MPSSARCSAWCFTEIPAQHTAAIAVQQVVAATEDRVGHEDAGAVVQQHSQQQASCCMSTLSCVSFLPITFTGLTTKEQELHRLHAELHAYLDCRPPLIDGMAEIIVETNFD